MDAGNVRTIDADGQVSKLQVRTQLEEFSLDEIQLVAATLDLGLATSASKKATITYILNWATTPKRVQQVIDSLNPE